MTGVGSEDRFPIMDSDHRREVAYNIAVLTLQASQLTDDFATVERIPRYASGKRENDVEHSFMLAVVAPEIAQTLQLDLDIDKVRGLALVHDLLEVKVGDVATFDLTPLQLAEKERIEQTSREALLDELPMLAAQDLKEYQHQNTREAVFVRLVDKLLPVAVDICGDGLRIIREDYGVDSYEALMNSHNALHARIAEKFGIEYPDLVAAHAVLCTMFEAKYLKTTEDTTPETRPRNPDETELKYLVNLDKLPAEIDLNNVRKSRLRQGYIAIGADGSETRVRSFDDNRFELTVKSPGMIARGEQTSKITKEMFDGLWSQTNGRQVVKTRYYIPYGDLTIELDVYEGHLQGLVTAEVEFDGRPTEAMVRANTFEAPTWFGENVSMNPSYKNHSLAQHLPHDPIVMGTKRY